MIKQTNAAINQLNQLVIWWDALSMIEKRVGANKEFMVRSFLLLFQNFTDFFIFFFTDSFIYIKEVFHF